YFVQLRIAKVNTEDTDNFLQHLAGDHLPAIPGTAGIVGERRPDCQRLGLSKGLILNTNTTTPLLKRLEALGIVKREKVEGDDEERLRSPLLTKDTGWSLWLRQFLRSWSCRADPGRHGRK
ncbi:MAG: hypothetical protein MZV63_60775, partial [Marinilabiliales bacterium]|nr:hypothetical protein [Marinilabiliales bacterium]